jgi:iron complex outermembrane receptor protein
VAEQRQGSSETYLRGPNGQPVYSGNINIDGKTYKLADTAFGLSQDQQTHTMHGVSLKSHTQGEFDWELSASLYDYGKDQQRVPTVAQPAANLGGKGTLQDQDGTGWNTLAAKGTWRQNDILGLQGTHIVDFGLGRDAYKLNISKYNVLGDWQSGPANEQSSSARSAAGPRPAMPGHRTAGSWPGTGRPCWACAGRTGRPARAIPPRPAAS